MPGVRVVIAHEGLGAAEDAFLWIIEGCGDDSLKAQGQDLCGFSCLVVKLIAHAMQKIIRRIDLGVGCGAEAFFFHQIFQMGDASFDARDPHDVVIVAQATTGFLDVWLLQKRCVPEFFVTAALILTSQFQKLRSFFAYTFFLEGDERFLIECLVACDQSRV